MRKLPHFTTERVAGMHPDYDITGKEKHRIRLYVQSIGLSLDDAIGFFELQDWVAKVGPTKGVVHSTRGKSITITPVAHMGPKKIKTNLRDSLDLLPAPSFWTVPDSTPVDDDVQVTGRDPFDAAVSAIKEILESYTTRAYEVLIDMYGQLFYGKRK